MGFDCGCGALGGLGGLRSGYSKAGDGGGQQPKKGAGDGKSETGKQK
jgi:hypothetical protein